jgi:hypothetical protein
MGLFINALKEIAKCAADAANEGAKGFKEGFNEVWYDEEWQKEKKELEAELKQNWQELRNKSDKDNDKYKFNF